jgi:hypothetical protein
MFIFFMYAFKLNKIKSSNKVKKNSYLCEVNIFILNME